MLIVLDTTTRTLKAKMDMAAMVSNCSVIVAYADHDGTNFTEGVDPSTLNGTTAVTILSAPASATRRVVKSITVYNPDEETHTTTLIFNDNGTEYGITRLTLPPGASWSSDDQTGVNVGGALTDGDKGDISVSGGGDTWTIDTNAVTLAKLATISSGEFLGRSTAGVGNVEAIGSTGSGNVVRATSATLTTPSIAALANLTTNGFVRTSSGNGTLSIDTNTYLTGNQAITLSGDVTGTGTTSLTATIASQAVTYAKIQNVSATSRILGRRTAGAGSIEEMTLSQTLDLIGSAAQGDILYRGASGWARLAAGTSGQVLRTNGAAADPSWTTVASGSLTVGTTVISSGTSGNVLYNNAGVLGEYSTVPVSEGGTGSSSLTANNVLLGNGTSALQVVAPGNAGNVLTSNGSTWIAQSANTSTCHGRLALGANPVSVSDIVSGSTDAGALTFFPYVGNKIALYNGSSWQESVIDFPSIDMSSYTAHTIYDIFAYLSSGLVYLESVSWGTNTEYSITSISAAASAVVTFNATGSNPFTVGTHVGISDCTGTNASVVNNVWTVTAVGGSSGAFTVTLAYVNTASGAPTVTNGKIKALDNTRATSLTRLNGVLVSNSNNTRRYLGTVKMSGNTGRSADTKQQRFVYNYYNQVKRLVSAYESTEGWDYAGGAWRPFNGQGTNRVEVVIGQQEQVVKLDVAGMSRAVNGGYGLAAVSIDSLTTIASDDYGRMYLASQPNLSSIGSTQSVYGFLPSYGTYEDVTAVGYHYFAAMETNNGSTSTNFKSLYDQLRNAGLAGEVMA